MRSLLLSAILFFLSSCASQSNIRKRHVRVKSKDPIKYSFGQKLVLPNLSFLDTIDTHDFITLIKSQVLSKPCTDSIFLIYPDSVVVYDPEHFTEYVKTVKRKVPLQLRN